MPILNPKSLVKHTFSVLLLTTYLTGCSVLTQQVESGYYKDEMNFPIHSDSYQENAILPDARFVMPQAIQSLTLADHVQILAQNLVGNMEYITPDTPIGVTHFAQLDRDLMTTNVLGLQIAESLVTEFHKFRLPVVDYKATEYIRVTPNGDFFLSRDYNDLKNQLPMDYIVTGTLADTPRGVMINARVLGVTTKKVVAATALLIPSDVVGELETITDVAQVEQ